jgi:TP901 family phage tail tape measure protein
MSDKIEKKDVISDEAIKAPYELIKGVKALLKELDKVRKAARGGATASNAANSTAKIARETQSLIDAHGKLEKAQTKVALNAKTLWLSQNEVANAQKRVRDESKKTGDVLNRMDRYQHRLANSATIYSGAQKKANVQTKQAMNNGTVLGETYKKLVKQLDVATLSYKNLYASGKATTDQLAKQGKVVQDLSAKVKAVNSAASGLQKGVGTTSGIFAAAKSGLGQLLSAFGLVGGIYLFARAVKDVTALIINYERANSRLAATLKASKGEMAELRKQQIDLGKSTEKTVNDVAALQLAFAQLGFPTKDIKDMAASTLDASIALGSGLGEQAELTGATLKTFGLVAKDAGRVNDAFVESIVSSAATFEKLRTAVPIVTPVLAKFNFTLENGLALLGELFNAGFDASSAATATRNIILTLADSSSELSRSLKEPVKDFPSLIKGLQQLAAEGTDLGEAFQLSDKRSVAAFTTLLNGSNTILELNTKIENADGAAARFAKTLGEDLQGDINKAKSAAEGFFTTILGGDSVFSKLLRTVTQTVTAFISMITPTTKLSTATRKEQVELNSLVGALLKTNKESKARKILVDELQEKYPEFLGNLKIESATNLELSLRLAEVNEEYKRKYVLQRAQEEQAVIINKQIDNQIKQAEKLKEITALENRRSSSANQVTPGLTGLDIARQQLLLLTQESTRLDAALQAVEDKYKDIFATAGKVAEVAAPITSTGKTKKELTEDEEKAALEVRNIRIKANIETLRKIIENENFAIDTRVGGLLKIEALEKELAANQLKIDKKRTTTIDGTDNDANRKILAENEKLYAQYSVDIINIAIATEEKIAEIKHQQAIKDLERAKALSLQLAEIEFAERKQAYDDEITRIQQLAVMGIISKEKAGRIILNLERDFSKQILNERISTQSELLNIEDKYYQEAVDAINGSTALQVDKDKKLLELKEAHGSRRKEIEQEIAALTIQLSNEQFDSIENSYQKQIDTLAKVFDVVQVYGSAISDLLNSISARRISNIERELDEQQEYYDSILKLTGDNEAAKLRIEREADQKRKVLEDRRIKEQRRAAIFDKATALTQAGISTALAVLVQLGSTPAISAIPRSIAAGVLGAIQIAAIAAKPIPQYEVGTKSAAGGIALVGEAGMEKVTTPMGKSFFTPSTATFMDIPKGSEVLTHEDTMRDIAMSGLAMSNGGTQEKTVDVARAIEKATEASSERIVKAINRSAGNLFKQGAYIHQAIEQESGSKKIIQAKVFLK